MRNKLFLITFLAAPIHASTLTVGPGAFLSIQAAVDASGPGDTVLVEPGSYPERIVWPRDKNGLAGQPIQIQSRIRKGASCLGFTLDTGGDYVVLDGFRVTTEDAGWQTMHGVWTDGSYVTVQNCLFEDCKGCAVNVTSSGPNYAATNPVIRGNTAYRCSGGFWAAANKGLIEDNTSTRLYAWRDQGFLGALGDCDHCRIFGDDSTVRGNRFYGSLESEISKSHVDGVQTYDNNRNHAHNLVIEANYIADVHEGMMFESVAPGASHRDAVIRNNVFHNIWSTALAIKGPTEVLIVNNTFADSKIHGVYVSAGGSAVVRNNLFWNVHNTAPYFAESPARVSGDHNLSFGQRPISPAIFPLDIINRNPLLVDLVNRSFELQPRSPAIDAGIAVPVFTDFRGMRRPQGSGWDIGAFEMSATPPHAGEAR